MLKRGRTAFSISFLAPAVILYAVFFIWPVLQAFGFSFFRWRGVSQNKSFVGLENYARLGQDNVFWQSLYHNLWILVLGGAVIVVVSIAIAHALQANGPGVRLLRGVYLFPQIISLVVVSVLWMFIYNPSFGILTNGMNGLGMNRWVTTWLADGRTALPAVAIAFVWYALGFYIMLFSAGLRSIPEEVTEAARLDGADGLKRFFKVTWPMLWSIKRIAVVYIVINSLNVFALVFLMTQGGPDRKTEVMLTYLYEQAFKNNEFGYSTALAVANVVVVMLISGLVLLAFRRDPQEARS